MPELLEFLKAYKDLGWAGLFLFTVYVFYKDLKSAKNESVEMTIKVTQALDNATSVNEDSIDVHKDVIKALDESKHNNQNFIEFLKGRDDERRRS